MMENMQYAEELVREFLVFRGFTNTLQVFETELSTDIGKGFEVDKIIDLVFSEYVPKFQAEKLVSLLSFLKQCLSSSSETVLISTLSKLEVSILRYYIIHALRSGRKDKVVEFFGTYGNDLLQRGGDWTPWFAIPYLKNPSLEPQFLVFFSRECTAASAMETSVLRKNSSTFDLSTGNSPKDVLVGDNLPLRNFYETSSSVSTSHLGESGFGVQVQGFADPAKVSLESTLSESEHDSSSLTRLPLQDVRSGDAFLMFQESVYSETSSEVQREEFPEVKVEFQETFLGHTSPISRCRFSAAGTNIASASADGTVRIWTYDSSTPTSRNATIYCGAEIMSLDWECKSDRLLLIGTADGGIKAWNVDAKRVVCDLSTTASFPSVLDLKCSPVDPIFVSAAASTGHGSSNIDKMGFASLTVWNMKTWKAMTVLPLGKDPPAITSLCFNHNGKILAASATDGMIHMFDMAAGLQITGWPAHDAAVSSVLFGPDETSIFSLGSDGKIFEWSLQNQGQVLWSRDCSRFCYPESTKNCRHEMALDSHGRRLLVTSDSVRSPIYQVQGHMSGLRTLPHSAAITTVDWHPTLPIFLTGSADHSVRVTSIS
ncbi:uncharacterized protein LOC131241318 isoform X2 [Magnolia sinica]|uniref:uncharacterized protein LOC131241318 isoform X2 n=1 Tax=Magnolia sinica TaxID=86752 RepID=UPI00265925BD|nr:uncharacterized protein LOC131241318 isoform X2 [Magnolia sinica]